MICRMAKPEEVLIVEDENGNIVRETMKDNDVLVLYKVNYIYIFLQMCLWVCMFLCLTHHQLYLYLHPQDFFQSLHLLHAQDIIILCQTAIFFHSWP